MKLIKDTAMVTGWDRWEDPGDYPSGAGGGPLASGPWQIEGIDGYAIYSISEAEQAKLEVEFFEWMFMDKGQCGLEDLSGLMAEFAKISVDSDANVSLTDVMLEFFPGHVIVVPIEWKEDKRDGETFEVDFKSNVKAAKEWMESRMALGRS